MNSGKTPQQAVAALESLGAEFREDKNGNITGVSLDHSKITDADMHLLEGLTDLKTLMIRGTQITDAGLVHLKGLTNLKECYYTIVRPGLDALKTALPKCYFSDEG